MALGLGPALEKTMFDGVRGHFIKAVGDGEDPKSIPEHYVKYYNDSLVLFRKFGAHQGITELHENFWPLICLMADMRKEIESLKSKAGKLEAAAGQATDSSPEVREPAARSLQPVAALDDLGPSTPEKIDGRTKEGKALKAAHLVEA